MPLGTPPLKHLSALLRDYPGKALGTLRVPIDLALVYAGIDTAGHIMNPWVIMVGVAGLISSIILIIFADRNSGNTLIDPQDASYRFKSLMFWKYPWEFASTMAFIKVINFFISGISLARFDDFFLGLCILIGQSLVQIPERKAGDAPPQSASKWVKIKDLVAKSPNRAGAWVMTAGNVVFALYALSPFELARFFAGVWNICLNTYLMARASKRLKD